MQIYEIHVYEENLWSILWNHIATITGSDDKIGSIWNTWKLLSFSLENIKENMEIIGFAIGHKP